MAQLVAEGAWRWRSCPRGAILSSADLTHADLRGANLTDAILFGANLANAYLRRATGPPLDISYATWTHAHCRDGFKADKASPRTPRQSQPAGRMIRG